MLQSQNADLMYQLPFRHCLHHTRFKWCMGVLSYIALSHLLGGQFLPLPVTHTTGQPPATATNEQADKVQRPHPERPVARVDGDARRARVE